MKTIKLTQGAVALVSDKDFKLVSRFKWSLARRRGVSYASRTEWNGGDQKVILMHRLIAGTVGKSGRVDHRDGNGLNNQRRNLRYCLHGQNLANSKLNCRNKSGFKGVSVHSDGVWQVHVSRKKGYVGIFRNKEDAARAYDRAAVKKYGKFAKTNKMLGLI